MATTGVPQFQDFLKTRYTTKRIADLTVRRAPTWAAIDKDTGFGGGDEGYAIPVILDTPQGLGGCFRAAQQNKTGGVSRRFSVTRRPLYGFYSITGELLRASEKKELSFLTARARNVDGLFRGYGREMAIHFFGDGTGRRGALDAAATINAAGTPIKLAVAADAKKLSPDMAISLVSGTPLTYRSPYSDDVGNQRGAQVYVKNVSEAAGTFTVCAIRGGPAVALSSVITDAQAGDFIVRDGDLNSVPHGLAGWIPDTDPAAGDNWFGVDRSLDPRKLAGLRYGSTGSPVTFSEASLIRFVNALNAVESGVNLIACSPNNWASLDIELGAKKQYVEIGAKMYRKADGSSEDYAGIGFRGLVIKGAEGDIAVMQDTFCPDNRTYGLDTDTISFSSNQEMPQVFDADGNAMLREATADAYEGRIGGEGNTVIDAPGFNGVMIHA